MQDARQFYIDGAWVDPGIANDLTVIDPATEQPAGHVTQASPADVDRAVAAARGAFESFARTTREERIELLSGIANEYKKRRDDIAEAIRLEMGAPVWLAKKAQTPAGLGHFISASKLLRDFVFDEDRGASRVSKEPIGVCALITPWNWPVNQIACKVAPALAAGCTMVLKPSEVAPLSAAILTEVLHDAGVPPGVFNLIQGDGPVVGARLAAHPDVDMVSFTGSTRGGIAVATAAAPTVKRVSQELGGKSANIILDDADLKRAVTFGVQRCVMNSGQSCNAPTRMLVAQSQYEDAVQLAQQIASTYASGDPQDPATFLGPVVSQVQWDRIQALIQSGITDGARLVCGGTGRPEGLTTGYYVKPTVFADVTNDMRIARDEIFGPVLVMIPYADEAEAIRIANDTPYGLSGYVFGTDIERVHRVAKSLRTGMVHINGAELDPRAPFGGYKQSGNGREWGPEGIDEYLEIKSMLGFAA
ncbi:MAG: aldehyde dehydrogenase family protein [Gammaproteobacteria bacterium]